MRHTIAQPQRKCRILIAKVGNRKNTGRNRQLVRRKRLVVVFKTVSAKVTGKGERRIASCMGAEAQQELFAAVKGHAGCGMLDCENCRRFFEMFCEDAESLCNPKLRGKVRVESQGEEVGAEVEGRG